MTDCFKDFNQDFVIYRECEAILLREISNYVDSPENKQRVLNGYAVQRADGSKCRVVMPQGGTPLLDIERRSKKGECQMFFVGFVGFAVKNPDDELLKATWEQDQKLIQELQNHTDIVCYMSTERCPGGDWVNLVIYSHPRAVDSWNNARIHSEAVRRLSPRLYRHVRIHRGVMEKGLYTERFGVQRTLFLKYDNRLLDVTERFVKRWCEEEAIQMENCYTL